MQQTQQLIKGNSDLIESLPDWAQELSVKYCSKTVNLYFVHGNIRDFLPHKLHAGDFLFVKIRDYISEVIFGNKDIIVFYDKSNGISFCLEEMQREYIKTLHAQYPDVPITDFFSRDPITAFSYLEAYFSLKIGNSLRMVLIVDYAETLIPADEIGHLDDVDRYSLVTLNRWSHDPLFTREDISVVMLTENLSDINSRLTSSASTVKVSIPFPDLTVRHKFLEYLRTGEELLLLERGLNIDTIAKLTSGLNLVNLHQLAAESFNEDKPLTLKYVRDKKRAIVENEAAGLLEFVDTDHNLANIAGHEFVKKRFHSTAKALKNGYTDVLPMGYLISGPMGTGKSFMVSAFAGEIGIPMVRLCNFRSQWKGGTTESNLEKVLNILKAMAPVAVMVDEADAVLGNRSADNASGSSHIFAQIANFMGNTDYRGKILWFLITCRPDLLPTDLKRQGRAEEHLSLFYPESVAEKVELFEILKNKLGVKVVSDVDFSKVVKRMEHSFVSGADIEAILVRSKMNATIEKRTMVTMEDIEKTLLDFIPPNYPHEIELQTLVAIVECTSKEMLPLKHRSLSRTKLVDDIKELKQLLGEI